MEQKVEIPVAGSVLAPAAYSYSEWVEAGFTPGHQVGSYAGPLCPDISGNGTQFYLVPDAQGPDARADAGSGSA